MLLFKLLSTYYMPSTTLSALHASSHFIPVTNLRGQRLYPHLTDVEPSSSTVRPTDQGTIVIEKIVCYSEFLRVGAHHAWEGHTGKRQGWSGMLTSAREHS